MRISRPHMWMDMAEVAAKRATCLRGNVGALVIHNNDIVSMGYNGPPSGEPHCLGNDCPLSESGGCTRSIHAEINANRRAIAKIGLYEINRADMYCTSSPCLSCASLIMVKRFFYRYPYRLRDGIFHLLTKGVRVYRVMPSGEIVRESDNVVMEDEHGL